MAVKPKLRGVSHATFSASALLQVPEWSDAALARARRVDHCVIFVTIAAMYTPYAVLLELQWGR